MSEEMAAVVHAVRAFRIMWAAVVVVKVLTWRAQERFVEPLYLAMAAPRAHIPRPRSSEDSISARSADARLVL